MSKVTHRGDLDGNILKIGNVLVIDETRGLTTTSINSTGAIDATSYSVSSTQVVGPQGAAVTDAAAATAVAVIDATTGTADDTVENVSTAVTGVDGVGNNAASKADVDARLIAINNNFKELVDEVNALITDVSDIRTQLNLLLARVRSHGLIA